MQISKTKKPSVKIITLLVTLLLGAGVAYAYFATDIFSDNNSAADSNTSDSTGINLDPSTEDEIKDGQNAKERILNEDKESTEEPGEPDTENTSEASKKPVTIGISFAGVVGDQLEIRAFSPTIISGSGTCIATISQQGSRSIVEESPAFIDASSTICQPIYIPRSKLSSGSWNVEVTYSSPTHKGSSGPTKIEVQ